MSLRDRVHSLPTMAVWSIAAVLLLAAVSPPLQAQDPTPLTGLRISNGRVQYSGISTGGCIHLSSSNLATHTSKWQRKSGAAWVDISGTERNGLCAYSTTSPGEYRVVADLTINGQRRLYTSENTFIVQGTAATAPGAPANLAATAGNGQVTLNWTAPANDGGAAITGYQYRQRAGGGAYGNWMNIAGGASTNSHVVSSLTNGSSYSFQVRAVNSEGGGAASASASATPTAPVTPPGTGTVEPESFSIPNRGGWSITSTGTEAAMRSGYGRISADAGSTTPSGIAIFQFRDSEGVLISEAGVPAAGPVREGRIFAEVNGPINTGLAIANPNDGPAFIQFYFTDTSGTRFAEGSFELGAHQQTAKFLDQAPFNGGPSVLGTLTFTSSLPVAVVALRGFTNEAYEFLMTTLPVASLSSAASDTVYFPHFADGSGWATQVVLVNPTEGTITGTVGFLGQGSDTTPASPVILALDDGRTGSSFDYSIPPRSAQRFTTSNPAGRVAVGSVRATPSSGTHAPSGLVVFSFASGGKTVSEAGVPALPKGSAFRVYVESSGTPEQIGSIRTGLAIANTGATTNTVTLEVTRLDGSLAVPPETLALPPSGQIARFLDEIFSLRDNFSGVVRVTSTAEVAIVGLRLRVNQRGELKVTTTPPSNETGPSSTAERFFPHIVDSEGWSTQFILYSGTVGQAASGTLRFIDTAGEPWDLSTALDPGSNIDPPPAPQVAARSGTDTVLDVTFTDSFQAGETRAYDFQVRTKTPLGSWREACTVFTNDSSIARTATARQGFTGLEPGTVYQVRYRYRNSSSCESGTPGQWSEIGEGATSDGATDIVPSAPQVEARSGTDTVLNVIFRDSFQAGETRAYDFQIRTKTPLGPWRELCNVVPNNSSNAVTGTLTAQISGLEPGTVYQVRYRYRNSSSCDSGSPGQWSEIGEGATSGESGGGGSGRRYQAGDIITTLPTGVWIPDVTRNGRFTLSGGNVTINLSNAGYIEEGVYRYTCENAGGCEIRNREVRAGTIVETSRGQ